MPDRDRASTRALVIQLALTQIALKATAARTVHGRATPDVVAHRDQLRAQERDTLQALRRTRLAFRPLPLAAGENHNLHIRQAKESS